MERSSAQDPQDPINDRTTRIARKIKSCSSNKASYAEEIQEQWKHRYTVISETHQDNIRGPRSISSSPAIDPADSIIAVSQGSN